MSASPISYRLLDLFCCAGGAGSGYANAGFEVVGVDVNPQPRYPFEFIQADAMEVLADFASGATLGWLGTFNAIHASPPCQGYHVLGGEHPRLIGTVREQLRTTGLPYVIENIPDARAHLREPITLCGSSFGLRVRRHRLFETSWPLMAIPCDHGWQVSNPHRIRAPYAPPENAIVPVYGGGQVGFPVEVCREAMEMPWATLDELKEAIPPAYTEFIGRQLSDYLSRRAVAA